MSISANILNLTNSMSKQMNLKAGYSREQKRESEYLYWYYQYTITSSLFTSSKEVCPHDTLKLATPPLLLFAGCGETDVYLLSQTGIKAPSGNNLPLPSSLELVAGIKSPADLVHGSTAVCVDR